ncbi:unknown [Acidaminococcus sp. CAG:542]|nr:unknown [Acidaminococcus sp. CAG:542]
MFPAAAGLVIRGGDSPFPEESVHASWVVVHIVPQLEQVVPTGKSRSAEPAAPIPGPQTICIVTLELPLPQVPPALAEGIQAQPVEPVHTVPAVEHRTGVRIYGLFQFGQVPFRVLGIRHPHGVPHIGPVLDGGRHIPQAAPIQVFTGKGSPAAVIGDQQQMPGPGDFLPPGKTGVINLDFPGSTIFRLFQVHLVPVDLAVQVCFHVEDPVAASESVSRQLLIRRIGRHVDHSPAVEGKMGDRTVPGHIPPGPVGQVQFQFTALSLHTRSPGKEGIPRIQHGTNRAPIAGQHVPLDGFPGAGGRQVDNTVRVLAEQGVLAPHNVGAACKDNGAGCFAFYTTAFRRNGGIVQQAGDSLGKAGNTHAVFPFYRNRSIFTNNRFPAFFTDNPCSFAAGYGNGGVISQTGDAIVKTVNAFAASQIF